MAAQVQALSIPLPLFLLLLLLSLTSVHCRSRNRGEPAVRCPTQCECTRPRHSSGVFTDCSKKGLSSIPVSLMDSDTVQLDMSQNEVRYINTDTFSVLEKLETLILTDNHIDNLEVNAFSGLNNLRILDLKRNRLRVLKGNCLASLSGHPQGCVSNSSCVIDLSENPIELIETNALAWIKRLSVIIGNSDTALTLKSYAFYGVQDLPTITIGDVPSLTLERHAITNAERVGSVRIVNTRLSDVNNFTFQGLEDVGSIVIHNSELSQIKTLGFGAVRYNKGATTATTSPISGETRVLTGGIFNMSYCQVAKLDTDLFKDTNLAHIILTGNRFYEIAGHTFRGLDNLKTFHMVGNTLNNLSTGALGSLSGVDELILERNQIDSIESGAFRGSKDIKLFRLSLKLGSNLTLSSYAFSDVLGVSRFELVGNSPVTGAPSFSKIALSISPDAFHDFVAERVTIENVSLPSLRLNTFRGLSKVKNLTFVSCDIEDIERGTFGAAYGAVHTLVMTEGSLLPCDCSQHRLVGEFKQTFTKFHVNCVSQTLPDGLGEVSQNISAMETMDWTFCAKGLGVKPQASAAISTIVVFIITLLIL